MDPENAWYTYNIFSVIVNNNYCQYHSSLHRKKLISAIFLSKKYLIFRDTSQTTSVASSQTETKLLGEISLFQKNRETVLVFGGRDPHKTYGVGRNTSKDVFRYLPDTNAWEFVGEIPEPRQHHSTEFYKGRIWLVGKNDDF